MSKRLASRVERFPTTGNQLCSGTTSATRRKWVSWMRRSVRVARWLGRWYLLQPWLQAALLRQRKWWAKIRASQCLPGATLRRRCLPWWRLAQANARQASGSLLSLEVGSSVLSRWPISPYACIMGQATA